VLDGTIFASATAAGTAARGVFRLSGPASIPAVEKLASRPGLLEECRGFEGVELELLVAGDLVKAWVVVYRAPSSYTREDMVEIHLPASAPLMGLLARRLALEEGVRRAGPGEFTLRAFRNGRIDLAQAEAVAQVISATGEAELRAAQRGLAGELGEKAGEVSELLTRSLALLESCIDFSDEDLPGMAAGEISTGVREAAEQMDQLRSSTTLRLAGGDGFRCVLAGLPNAGKSSLLNTLLGSRAALVSELAGTTRDPVRAATREAGLSVMWVDLAGSCPEGAAAVGLDKKMNPETRTAVERLTRFELEYADAVLWLVDATSDPAESLEACAALDSRVKLLIFNKADLLEEQDRARLQRQYPAALFVSALKGTGISSLREAVRSRALKTSDSGLKAGEPPDLLVSAHQESALQAASGALERALEVLAEGLGLELAAADLRDALRCLEDLTGKVTPDDVLAHVFSSFCIGK
jgi:tRNA modification GTPase